MGELLLDFCGSLTSYLEFVLTLHFGLHLFNGHFAEVFNDAVLNKHIAQMATFAVPWVGLP